MSSDEQHQHQHQPQQQQQPPHQDRRRPFSVSDLNRRTREVKIYNTTTITTTTHNFDSSEQQTTSTIYSDGTQQQTDNSQAQTFAETFTTVNGQQIPIYTSGDNVQRKVIVPGQPLRSKSAFSTNSDHYQYNSLPLTITTNSSINAYPPQNSNNPNRKIQFIYGKDANQQPHYDQVHHEESAQDTENCEPFPKFPNVRHTVSTEISDPYFIQCNCRCNCNCSRNAATTSKSAFRKQGSEDSYDNCRKYTDRSSDNLVGNFNKKNMRVKDVEVECEIEEDPAIFEGSEGYVKNLISKIQQQYKNPETVHIKITRRQKPENIDANGNLIQTANESYGQIVRKEYYTIRTTNRPKKTSSMSSFVDTANIPYIDGSDDDRSARNSRIDMEKNLYIPNYTIEKHVIYNEGDEKKPKKDRPAKVKLGKEVGIRDLVSSLGGVIKKENLDIDRSESMSPTRLNESLKVKTDKNRSKSVAVSEEDVKLHGGLSGFFKCGRSGRVKSPEVKKEKEPKPPKEPKAPKPEKVKADKNKQIKLPDVDIDVNAPKVDVAEPIEVKVDVPEVDVNSEEYKNGMRGFFKGLGGKVKIPEAEVKVKEVHVEAPEPEPVAVEVEIKKPEVDLEALTAEIDASLPKVEREASVKKEKEKKPPKERKPKKDSFEFKVPKMPDFHLPRLPKYEGEVETPKIDLEAEVPEANVEVEVPQTIEIEVKEPEVPVVDVEIVESKPIDWEIDPNAPEYNSNMKDFFKGLGGNVQLPEADVNVEEVNVTLPEIEEPKPAVEIEVKQPKVKKPKYDRKYELTIDVDPSVRSSDVDAGVVVPTEEEMEIDINSPEYKSGVKGFFKGIGGKIKAPEVYLPDMIIGAPEIDIKEPKVKKVKEPKAPKVKEPKVKKPKIEVSVPDVEVPEVEVEVETKAPELEIDVNSPEYKSGMRGFFKGLGGKVKLPEAKVTEIEVTSPEVAVDVETPEVQVPEVDVSVESPDMSFDVNSPEYNSGVKDFVKEFGGKIQMPEGEVVVEAEVKPPKQRKPKAPKIDLPDFTMPKFKITKDDKDIEIKSPEVEVEMQPVKAPELEIDVNSPEYKNGLKGFFKGIGGKVKLPEAKVTEVEVKSPEVTVEVPEVEAPKVEVAVEVPEVQAPEVDVSVESPDMSFDINSPEYKSGLKGFFKGLGGKVDVPSTKAEVEVEAPKVDVNVEAPQVDVEVDAPKVKSSKVKTPKERRPRSEGPSFRMPSLCSRSKSKPKKTDLSTVDVDVVPAASADIDLTKPEMDIDYESPEYKGGLKSFFKGLGGKIKAPESPVVETNITAPEVQVDVEVKEPELPVIEAPEIDVEIKTPEVNIETPKVEVEVEAPKVDLDIDVNSPEYKNGMKGFFQGLGGKVQLPEAQVTEVEVKTPEVEVEAEVKPSKKERKPRKRPTIELPDFHLPRFRSSSKAKKERDVSVDADLKSPEVDAKVLDVEVDANLPKIEIDETKVIEPEVEVIVPEVTPAKKVDLDYDINSEEYQHGLKDFLSNLGGKVKLSETHVQAEKPDVEVETVKVEVEAPKIDVEVKAPETKEENVEIDINSQEYKHGIKGFFKGIGGKIKAPEVNVPLKSPSFEKPGFEITEPEIEVSGKVEVPDIVVPPVAVYNVQTERPEAVIEVSEVEESTTVITKVRESEEIKKEESQKTDIYIRGLNLDEHKQFVYGIDLPMTIVNNDWHWSPESVREGIDERKIFFRQYTDEDSDKTSSNYINSGSFPMGNLSLITNTELSTTSSASRSRAVDYELKKTKITKEKVTQKPGKAAIKERDQSVPKSKSSTGSFFRKLSSASSISNLDLKKSFQAKASNITRSESADPSSRTKIDYSIPRKCYILTKPDFNGLGIHIACDKKTRRFPYIYEIEPNSPGLKSGLRKNDFILEVNDQDAVDMEFKELINRIQEYIKTNNLCLTVGNEKAHKKWIKARSASLNRTKSKV